MIVALKISVKKILLIGHIGKFAKLGCGIMNTHSHNADGRIETLVTCGLKVGADLETLKEVANAVTTDDAIDILKERGFFGKNNGPSYGENIFLYK